jgi:hypothetical protein
MQFLHYGHAIKALKKKQGKVRQSGRTGRFA